MTIASILPAYGRPQCAKQSKRSLQRRLLVGLIAVVGSFLPLELVVCGWNFFSFVSNVTVKYMHSIPVRNLLPWPNQSEIVHSVCVRSSVMCTSLM